MTPPTLLLGRPSGPRWWREPTEAGGLEFQVVLYTVSMNPTLTSKKSPSALAYPSPEKNAGGDGSLLCAPLVLPTAARQSSMIANASLFRSAFRMLRPDGASTRLTVSVIHSPRSLS